ALKYTAVPARTAPLTLLGPPGTLALLKALAEGFGPWLLDPGFPLAVLEFGEGPATPLDGSLSIEAFPVPHTAESVALSVTAPEGRLVYTGDTGPSDELARWASGCDLLLAECSLPEALAIDIHLTPERAGDLARAAGTKHLVLTHFYPPVENTDPARIAAARSGGRVTAARNGDRFTIGGTTC
ncbi:MAG TPA: MBL fold metallo-hydrolase, partial [Gemmatimonadales bacterium]|nr:MBL fold metallo-hydrolase [Gemmatimonadales bacterium]